MSFSQMPPHWLDDVFENVQDAEELLHFLLDAPEMRAIALKAFQAGEKQRKLFEENPNLCAPGVAQVIRQGFLGRINELSRESALA